MSDADPPSRGCARAWLQNRSPSTRTWFAFLGVIAAWGSSYLFIRMALESWNPLGIVATRFAIAGTLCAIIAYARRESFPRGRQAWVLALVGVMMMTGSNALTAWAQRSVSSGIAGVMHSLGSVWLAALGSLPSLVAPSSRRPRPAFWLGVPSGVFGVALLMTSSAGQLQADLPGMLALLAATLLFAVACLVQRAWQSRGPPALFAQLAVQMAGGSGVALVLAVATTGITHREVTARAGLAMIWLVLVASIVGFASYASVLRSWPPARAGSFAVINPIVSVLLGVLFAGETISLRMVFGALVSLASVAWVQWCHR